MLDALKFNDGAVIVTGGGTGIGQACCVEFAKLGGIGDCHRPHA